MMSLFSSSRRPKWLNRKLRDRSRSTSCSAGHDSASSSGASKSFSIHAEYKFSVARFHVSRTGQTLFAVARGADAALGARRSRGVIVLHSAGAPSRASVACHVPTAGVRDLGEPEIRRPAVALTRCGRHLSIGRDQRKLAVERFSAVKTTRNGAPFHGAIGEARTASPAASSQPTDGSFGLCVRCRHAECTCDQQQCRRSRQQTGVQKTIEPPGLPRLQLRNTVKASG